MVVVGSLFAIIGVGFSIRIPCYHVLMFRLKVVGFCSYFVCTIELYKKSQPKLQFVYSKRKVNTKLFYAPKRDEKKFGLEYEVTN